MKLSSTIMYCRSFAISEYEELVIIANTNNGMNFKMTKECFLILDECIKSNKTLEMFFEQFEEQADREYFERIIEVLLDYKIIVYEKEKAEFNVILELTNRCNLRCNHCCMDAMPVTESDELSTREWKDVVDKLVGLSIQYVTITGGEPLVRKDFFEISEYVKARLNVPLLLMSNATLITEENAPKLLELFEEFSFSLDGVSEETCAPVRGKGVFQRAMQGIEIMKSLGMNHFSLSFTKVKQNAAYTKEFKELAESLGATPMIRSFDVVGRAKQHLELLPEDIDDQFRPHLSSGRDIEVHYYPENMPICACCRAIDNKFCISNTGDIYPCQALRYPEFLIDNVKNIESLASYFNNGKQYLTSGYEYFKEIHTAFSKKCADCPAKLFCENCVLYMYLMKHRENFEELCDIKRKGLIEVWS